MGVTGLLNLLGLAIPAVTNLILLIKNESGSTTAIISSTETANAADIAQIQAWLAAHHAGPTGAPTTPPAVSVGETPPTAG
jgi:hypothetical protein